MIILGTRKIYSHSKVVYDWIELVGNIFERNIGKLPRIMGIALIYNSSNFVSVLILGRGCRIYN